MALEPPRIDSDQEYSARLNDGAYWEPYARLALDRAGLPDPGKVMLAEPVGTYPTLIADTGLVVKMFGDRWWGSDSSAAERDAYRVLAGSDLPVPALVATGELFPAADGWSWPFVVITEVSGIRLSRIASSLSRPEMEQIARDIGSFLRELHQVPLTGQKHLAPKWDAFTNLLIERRSNGPEDHRRWANLPSQLLDQLDDGLPDLGVIVDVAQPPRFVHGDLHMDHFFVDPQTKRLGAVIDFTDVHAGDPRYDLLALHFGAFGTDKGLLAQCLDAYGWPATDSHWSKDMLALALLHDFNMFKHSTELDRFSTLDDLAEALWNLDDPRMVRTLFGY